MTSHIAVVDDEVRITQILEMILNREGYQVSTFNQAQDFLNSLDEKLPDLVLTDFKMPQISGLDILKSIKNTDPLIPVILMTAHGSIATAVESMKEGAYDFIEKPFDNEYCLAVISKALNYASVHQENRQLRAQLQQRYHMDDFIVASEEMEALVTLAKKAAHSRATIIIQGASGSGKEMLAKFVHFNSSRVSQDFIAVNCKAFAKGVLESELFGHEKGAYTGADRRKIGTFERAHKGTLFLDEIGEVDLDFQGKILRVLQERELQRIGGQETIPVDFRLIAATNKDLKAMVKEGIFREDLYFRLAVIPLIIPPLRNRKADILPLSRFFVEKYARNMQIPTPIISKNLGDQLESYEWPGNVRELENAIERAIVISDNSELIWEDFLLGQAEEVKDSLSLAKYIEEKSAEYIKLKLDEHQGQKIETAKALGIERSTLYRLIKKYNL